MIQDSSNMVMPVSPMYGNGGGYGDSAWGGGGFFWLLVIFVIAAMGGNGWGFGGGGNGSTVINNDLQRGFDQQALMGGINGVTAGINTLAQTQCNAFANAEIAANARQTSILQAMNDIAMAQQNCCCENRAAVADLKYAVATEACADRAAVSDALNATLNAMNAGIQSIKDQMCQDKIDAKNEQIANLQTQLQMANLAASQTAQTSRILADNAAQTIALEQYLNPTPVPAYVVQNPNCCSQNYGCGCSASY